MLSKALKYCLILFPYFVNAQNFEIEPFQIVYENLGNQRLVDVLEQDTTLIMLGYSSENSGSSIEIIRSNKADGKIISSSKAIGKPNQQWNPFQLFKDINSDFWVVCEQEFNDHSKTHIVKLDNNYEKGLDYIIGSDSTYQRMNYMMERNGFFYLSGTYSSPSLSYGNDFWVIKMSKTGDVIWDQHYGIDTVNEVASSLQIIDDKIYVFGDKNKPDFTYNPYLLVLDTNGVFIRETQLDWPYNGGVKKSCITQNHIYVTGESATSTSSWFDIYLEKYDLNGNNIWRKLVEGSSKSETGFDIEYYQGNLFLTGYAYNFDLENTDMHSTILDTSGKILSQKLYNLGNVDIGFQILPTNTGGYYVVGDGKGENDTEYMLVYDTTKYLTVTNQILKKSNSGNVKIYPNPGVSPTIILNKNHNFESFKVFTLEGKFLFKKNIDSNNIKLPLDRKGVYIIEFSNKNSILTKTIIIQ